MKNQNVITSLKFAGILMGLLSIAVLVIVIGNHYAPEYSKLPIVDLLG